MASIWDERAMNGFGAFTWFEAAVVGFIVAVFILNAGVTLRAHAGDELASVLVGAGIYGFIVGLVIAFAILPLRVVLISGDVPNTFAALGAIGLFATMFALRRGAIGRMPFLGGQVTAYRRAQLRRGIAVASAQLARLETRVAGSRDPDAATNASVIEEERA